MKAKSMLTKFLLRLLFFLLIAVCSVATAKIIYVDDKIGTKDSSLRANTNSPEEPVYFADANLKQAVEEALGVTNPTPTDMLRLSDLYADRLDITDLSGLEYAINLDLLVLYHNQITDISPLSGLTSLNWLSIGYNQISDISPLSGLTNLKKLHLEWNPISDISPLSGLTRLKELWSESNQISDISPLSGLTNLDLLDLLDNQIIDISPLSELPKLRVLYLLDNQISDISPLSGLTSLESLDLRENLINDITPLSGLAKLRSIYLNDNQIDNVSPLSELTSLQYLRLSENQIIDIFPLSSLIELQYLSLNHNQINDISPLSKLTMLQELNLNYNQISELSPLSDLTSLQILYLENNQLSDISPLSGLTNLELLHLGNRISFFRLMSYSSDHSYSTNPLEVQYGKNQIIDISPLSNLTSLQELQLADNLISDISPLFDFTNLQILDLRSNLINNILPLSGLINLQKLKLSTNQISDISPISGITNLWELWLRENPLDIDAYNIYIPLLQSYGTMVSHDPLVWRTLTINSTDGGSVIEPGEGDFDYTNSTTVNIQAMADPGYYFTEWTGTAVYDGDVTESNSAGTTVIMNKDCTLQANFDESYVIYVDDDAVGLNDGSSWHNAYTFLQDALVDAEISEKPVEIRVAQGTYTPDKGAAQTPGDREATFQLINGVTLKGSYAGITEPDPNARDIESYQTILSGDLLSNDIEVNDPCELLTESTRAENSYHVVICVIEETTILDGFTITAGNADETPFRTYSIDGGTYDSYTTYVNVSKFAGGGMFNNSNLFVSNCTFSKNSASYGGGVYNNGFPAGLTGFPEKNKCTFYKCIFTMNYAAVNGGGMRSSRIDINLSNCIFSENSATGGGGGMDNGIESDPILKNCTFFANSANSGAGIKSIQCDPILTNCIFTRNIANSNGGGIYSYSCSNAVLVGCKLIENWAFRLGGGIYNRGIYNQASCPMIKNCIFNRNSATLDGGGVYAYLNSNPMLTNCTFEGNNAESSGSGICNRYMSNSILKNCILWDGGDEISNIDNSSITITYSNIQGGWEGEGNIDEEPLFAELGYWADADDPSIIADPNDPNTVWIDGDYHLKSQAGRWDPVSESWIVDDVTSPCIDTGDPNSPIGHEPFPNGGIINMGAYGGTDQASLSLSTVQAVPGIPP